MAMGFFSSSSTPSPIDSRETRNWVGVIGSFFPGGGTLCTIGSLSIFCSTGVDLVVFSSSFSLVLSSNSASSAYILTISGVDIMSLNL